MSHHCHAAGCLTSTRPEMFMCKKHWYMLPQHMRDEIWKTYRPGQCDDKRITTAYANAARRAVTHLARVEGKTDAEIRAACMVYDICEVPDKIPILVRSRKRHR